MSVIEDAMSCEVNCSVAWRQGLETLFRGFASDEYLRAPRAESL